MTRRIPFPNQHLKPSLAPQLTNKTLKMTNLFIATQCFQCSIMQVKQQKKSSNKWTCVVCNEKQSIRRVFAQSSVAKDIRGFVQRFNMARQVTEEGIRDAPVEEEEECVVVVDGEGRKMRNDWSEYLDDVVEEDVDCYKGEVGRGEGNILEPKVVTELPKEMYKKPKLMDSYSARFNNSKGFKPTISKRATIKTTISQEINESIKSKPTKTAQQQLKLSHYLIQDDINDHFPTEIIKKTTILQEIKESVISQPTKTTQQQSKWTCFLIQDAEYNLFSGIEASQQDASGMQVYAQDSYGVRAYDQRVEDDIHPDFI